MAMAHGLHIFDSLKIADPDTFARVQERMAGATHLPGDRILERIAEQILWGLSQERGLAGAFTEGLFTLACSGLEGRLGTYVDLVHQAARTGATLGRIVATFSAAVVAGSEPLLDLFRRTLAVMQAKGTYTLSAPFEALAGLLSEPDEASAAAYLELLYATFHQRISYNASLRLAYLLPKAVAGFAPKRRLMHIRTLTRLVQTDLCLVDPFLEGLSKGLGLLAEPSLTHFVGTALKRYEVSPAAAVKYLGLSSKVAQDDCAAMQQALPLNGVRGRLNRYLQARIGRSVVVRPLSDLGIAATAVPWICSDGRAIYLMEENSYFDSTSANADLYKTLTRLEAGYFEYGTFDFDLERAVDQYPEVGRWIDASHRRGRADACDGEIFVSAFQLPELADDLFTLFEQVRIAGHMHGDYPGLMRGARPALQHAFDRLPSDRKNGLLAALYGRWMLDLTLPVLKVRWQSRAAQGLTALYAAHRQHHRTVEKSADLVCRAIQVIVDSAGRARLEATAFDPPFGRRLHWNLVSTALSRNAAAVDRLKAALDRRGLHVYRSDVRQCLAERDGRLNVEDIKSLVLSTGGAVPENTAPIAALVGELEGLLGAAGAACDTATANQDPSFRYPEWDVHLQEYLYDHTWVREIALPGNGDGDAYRETLARHHGLVARMRRAFELLKPEGMTLLRQWPEGDAFDYRAMIEFVIDRRAGRIPSQRLYIKRLKALRDVAVLLLVDLSRSTANPVQGRQTTVLAVAKEALVLFCEALQVAGDRYAIAGFSGTGRHNVDYFRIKDFDEPLSQTVQARISALTPHRSTRMGAAVRHAAEHLDRVASRVRLLIVLSDGFPNDLGYKSDYAIADTGRAVQEARARNFHVKAITVNIGSDPRLDELYGRVHHQVIGDVTELPDKLLRWYGILTRY